MDLKHRLFKYPCSYLIYSDQFDGLPCEAKAYVYHRLWEVLTGRDDSKAFDNLCDADRDAIFGETATRFYGICAAAGSSGC